MGAFKHECTAVYCGKIPNFRSTPLYMYILPYFAYASNVCFYEIVGEPKSRIVQKHTFFAPERYTAGILYTDSLKVLDMKPLYSNATRIAFRGKMHFLYAT